MVWTASEDRLFPKCLLLEVQDSLLASLKVFWASVLHDYANAVRFTWPSLKVQKLPCGTRKKRLGVYSIDQIIESIVESTPVASSGKRLTNHWWKSWEELMSKGNPSFRLLATQVNSHFKITMKAPNKNSNSFPTLSATISSCLYKPTAVVVPSSSFPVQLPTQPQQKCSQLATTTHTHWTIFSTVQSHSTWCKIKASRASRSNRQRVTENKTNLVW